MKESDSAEYLEHEDFTVIYDAECRRLPIHMFLPLLSSVMKDINQTATIYECDGELWMHVRTEPLTLQ